MFRRCVATLHRGGACSKYVDVANVQKMCVAMLHIEVGNRNGQSNGAGK